MKKSPIALYHTFNKYRWHISALVFFGIVSPLLEGIGINAVIPLMSFFMGGDGTPTDFVTKIIYDLFAFLGLPFRFRFLLSFIFLLFVLRAVSVVVFGYIRGWINADFLSKESEDVMRRTILSSWPFLLKQKIGTMHNTLVRDVQQTGALLGSAVQVIQSFSGFFIYLLIAVNISPMMTLYAISGGGILLFFLRPFLLRSERIGEAAAETEKQFAQFLSEHIIGLKSIKAAGVERAAISSGRAHIHRLRHFSIRQSLMNTLSSSFFQPASLMLVVLLFLLIYRTPQFTIISFVASLYLIQKIFAYLESGQNAMQSMKGLLPYAKNLEAFKRELNLHRESTKGIETFSFEKNITFEDVSFGYSEGRSILKKISFSIETGKTIGLIGPSGAGKTSIADLLLRLFEPTEGVIFIDGVSSQVITLEKWRQYIGYVSQDVFLLNDTIEENIRFYNQTLTNKDIEEAAKQANIYDFIRDLPKGFATTTGDRGVMLSGGQRQRIALARALARKPKLLILDEATSALDHESEKLIHEAIAKLHGIITVVIIAHRASTVAEADTIFVLNRGHIIEQGSPQELLKDNDSYFSKMQFKV